MTHWHDRLTKGSDWKEKIITPLTVLAWIGALVFFTYLSGIH
jgi:hypothetical protein